MRKKMKKAVPLLLALMLMLSASPLTALTAYAEVTSAATEDALRQAVNKGGDIKLTADIDLSAELDIPEGLTVSLDLNGKTLNRGLTDCVDHGGVILVNPGAALTVTDSSGNNLGTITGGASWNGGGICNHGTLVFEGGTIENCKALHNTYGGGGGIFNDGLNGSKAALTLRGGLIRNNEARNGGGVYNGSSGTLVIEKKTAIKNKKEIITNVKITENKAGSLGGGICNNSAMSMKDAPEIFNNTDHDIYTSVGKKINITGALTFKNKMSVKSKGTNVEITKGYPDFNSKKPTEFFVSADRTCALLYSDTGEAILKNDANTVIEVIEKGKLAKREETSGSDFAGIWNKALGYAKNNKCIWGFTGDDSVVEITLGRDCSFDSKLNTGAYKNIVIDLNGHCLKREGKKKKDGCLFNVGEGAKLTVRDSNPGSEGYADHKGGVLADGNGDDCGGGIIVEKYGQFYMTGGTIYNCITDYHGGAVYANADFATIHMKNCAIDSCRTKDSGDDCHGGGIYVKNAGNVVLENVTIKNCSSEDKGGGLYLREKPRNVKLSNVTFESNFANDGGGAIFIDDLNSGYEFTFEAENCTFKKNKADNRGGAVYVNDDDESEYRNATIFRNCTFTENESKHNGSAIEVNDNGVVLSGGTFTKNKTSEKGAIYVEDRYDISVAGKLVVKNNTGKSGNRNFVLEKDDKTAYIYCAGLYPGSEIFVSTSNGKTGVTGIKDVSDYQSKYFHAEKGSLNFKKTGEKTANMITASLFGEGSKTVIFALAGAAVAAVAIALIVYKKRKGAARDDEDEE